MIAVAQNLNGRAILNRNSGASVLLVLGGAALVVIIGWIGPVPALLRGWLVALAIASTIPIGSTVLLMIHRLTGGRWGFAASPVLRPAAALLPLVLLASLPILVAQPLIFPWAADPSHVPDDMARWYLNEAWFALRSLIALAGWSMLGVVFAAGAGGILLAALGLTFFGLSVSLLAVDWFLSLDPHYVSSAFAATIAIQQLLAALALTALIGPSAILGKAAGDIGGLLIATLLGVVYLSYMSFVVAWYGDLPDKAAWYLARSTPVWLAVLVIAFAIGAVLPFAMLLLKSARNNVVGLRVAGALILAGSVLHFAWLLIPAFDDPGAVTVTALAGLLSAILIGFLGARGLASWLEARHAE